MLNFFFSWNHIDQKDVSSWLLWTLSRYSRQIIWVLWITWAGVVLYDYIWDKNDANQVALSSNTWDIVVWNKKWQESSNNRDNDEWFVMAKVTKKWIWVLEFMNENWFDWDWKNLVNRRTWKRVIDPRRDLIFGETYILAENDKYAERLAFLITHKNKRVVYADKWLNNLSEGSKTPLVAKIEQKTSKEQNSPSVVANWNSLSGQKIQKPASEKWNELTRFSYKDYIEWKLKEAVVPELDQEITQIFRSWWIIWWSLKLLEMTSYIESTNGRFLWSYQNALIAKGKKDHNKVVEYLNEIVSYMMWWDNDIWIFQITPIWLKEEIRQWYVLKWNFIDDKDKLKAQVKKVVINAVARWLSPEKFIEELIKIDIRFDTVQMWMLEQNWFIRTSKHYNSFPSLSPWESFILTLTSYNVWQNLADKIAREVKNWNLHELFKKYWITDIYKRIIHLLNSNSEKSWVVSQAMNSVKAETTFIVKSLWLSESFKSKLLQVLEDWKLEIFMERYIAYYKRQGEIWKTEQEREDAKKIWAKLKVLRSMYNDKVNKAILWILANWWNIKLKKAA